jgi:hypothetical protein
MAAFACALSDSRRFQHLRSCLRSYLHHIKLQHANDANFHIACGLSGCKCEYDKYLSFYRHLYRKHESEIGRLSENTNDDRDNYDENMDRHNDEEITCLHGSATQVAIGHVAFKGKGSFFTIPQSPHYSTDLHQTWHV